MNLPSKLVDAWSKDRTKCELFITEGDMRRIVAQETGEISSCIPVGKIISARKARPQKKVYANQEVSNIVKALGLEVDKQNWKINL